MYLVTDVLSDEFDGYFLCLGKSTDKCSYSCGYFTFIATGTGAFISTDMDILGDGKIE
jgi:hypothetical protein